METKIRAWDVNQMLYKDIFDLNWYSTESNDEKGCNTVRKMIPSDRDFPTMFSTGQKDKNGKKIYEDDFVKINNYTFRVMYNSFECAFVLNCIETTYNAAIRDIGYDTMEVIGNIHQNPELL